MCLYWGLIMYSVELFADDRTYKFTDDDISRIAQANQQIINGALA